MSLLIYFLSLPYPLHSIRCSIYSFLPTPKAGDKQHRNTGELASERGVWHANVALASGHGRVSAATPTSTRGSWWASVAMLARAYAAPASEHGGARERSVY